jgi:CheY-like chemotaxis protein
MKVLIVEDDENKRSQLIEFLKARFICDILVAKAYKSGMKKIIEEEPNVILLDMTMPTYDIGIDEDGGRPQHYAGREILRQMDRRNINIPTWVVTGFDLFGEGSDHMSLEQLNTQLLDSHPLIYKGMIHFTSSAGWKIELNTKLSEILKEQAND